MVNRRRRGPARSSINWADGGNWSGGAAPTAGDDVVLTNAGSNRPTNQNISALSINSLTFDATMSTAVTISGNSITLTSPGTALNVLNPLPLTPPPGTPWTGHIIQCPLVIGANNQTWYVDIGPFDDNPAHIPQMIFTVNSVVSDGGLNYGLTKNGLGSLYFLQSNTYNGVTTILQGQLAVYCANGDCLGVAPATPTPGRIVLNGGTFWDMNSATLNPNCGIALGPSGGNGTGFLAVHYDQTLTYSGIIADNSGGISGLSLVAVGSRPPFKQGVLCLSGPNTYSGDTHVLYDIGYTTDIAQYGYAGGSLQLGAANTIPNGPGKGNVIVDAGGFFDLSNYDATINGLSGGGWVDTSSAQTLTVGNNNATSTFSGVMQNSSGSLSVNQDRHRHVDSQRRQYLRRRDDG